MSDERAKYHELRKLHTAQGNIDYCLAVFGDHLAEREGYQGTQGMDAIHFYLVHKFSWPPAQVRGISLEDIRFILSEEMHGWTLPDAARQ